MQLYGTWKLYFLWKWPSTFTNTCPCITKIRLLNKLATLWNCFNFLIFKLATLTCGAATLVSWYPRRVRTRTFCENPFPFKGRTRDSKGRVRTTKRFIFIYRLNTTFREKWASYSSVLVRSIRLFFSCCAPGINKLWFWLTGYNKTFNFNFGLPVECRV